jgi:hypothetical protein
MELVGAHSVIWLTRVTNATRAAFEADYGYPIVQYNPNYPGVNGSEPIITTRPYEPEYWVITIYATRLNQTRYADGPSINQSINQSIHVCCS